MNRTCDVLIVGAGVAGVPAAVAAARAGASLLLAERRGSPGGAGVTALHRVICGLYTGGDTPPAGPLNDGITAEICDRLLALSPNSVPTRAGRTYVLPYSNADLGSIYAEMIAGEDNLEVLYDTVAVNTELHQDRISRVMLRHNDNGIIVAPRAVIDCSGIGVLLATAGAGSEIAHSSQRQLAGFTVLLAGVRHVDDALSVKVAYALRTAADAGRLPRHLMFSSLRDAGPAGACLKLSLLPDEQPGRRSRAMADVALLCRVLAETLPEFVDADITDAAEEVMDRDGLRLRGRHMLTEDDVLAARKFAGAAARSAWPIEFWDQQTGPSYRYVPAGDWYEIPPDCLRSGTVSNLFCAGRCISASPTALASTRVMGACMALGEAAGALAAGMRT